MIDGYIASYLNRLSKDCHTQPRDDFWQHQWLWLCTYQRMKDTPSRPCSLAPLLIIYVFPSYIMKNKKHLSGVVTSLYHIWGEPHSSVSQNQNRQIQCQLTWLHWVATRIKTVRLKTPTLKHASMGGSLLTILKINMTCKKWLYFIFLQLECRRNAYYYNNQNLYMVACLVNTK